MTRLTFGFAFTLTAAMVVSFSHAATIPTVTINNPGNPADTRYPLSGNPGSVPYIYSIATTETTWSQYAEFLNAVAATDTYALYQTSQGTATDGGIVRSGSPGGYTYAVKSPALSGAYAFENKPVKGLNFGDVLRYVNWLHNGSPTGAQDSTTTENGAYTLNGATTNAALYAVNRNPGARWFVPTENEWYKAAYYDPATSSYNDYPTGGIVPNTNLPPSNTGDSANYLKLCPSGIGLCYATGDEDYPFTDVGAYTLSASPYGTFDQGGNVKEWTERKSGSPSRFFRGGSALNQVGELHASDSHVGDGITVFGNVGFRVASNIPEPGTTCLAALALMAGCCSTRVKRHGFNRPS